MSLYIRLFLVILSALIPTLILLATGVNLIENTYQREVALYLGFIFGLISAIAAFASEHE